MPEGRGLRRRELMKSSKETVEKSIQKKIENLLRNLEEREIEPEPRLMGWSEDERVMPTDFLRTSLFKVEKKGRRRKYYVNERIAALGNLEVYFSGEELQQNDLDVFLNVLHLARGSDTSNEIIFSANSLHKQLGKKNNCDKKSKETIKRSLERLSSARIKICTSRGWYIGSLLDDAIWDEGRKSFKVRINPRFAALLRNGFTKVEWKKRLEIDDGFSKWLYSFVSSYNSSHPLNLETMMLLSGTSDQQKRRFKTKLRKSFEVLIQLGVLKNFKIEKEKIYFERRV